MHVRALRGATTVDEDAADEIERRTVAMVAELLERNELTSDDLISIQFSATPDVVAAFPATAARAAFDLADVPLLNCVEMNVVGSLPRCIRLLAHAYTNRTKAEIHHVYQHGAAVLRPDLANRDHSA